MSDEQFRQDELVSAYLDGEATPAEIAEVEQDDVLMARVEQLRSVRDAVAAPVAPMPADRREEMISAALAGADAENAQRRDARIVAIRRRRETLLAVAAAAVLLAAVVSASLIASRGGDDSDDIAATAVDSDDMAAEAPAEMAEADEAAPAEEAVPAPSTTDAYVATQEEEPTTELEAATDATDVVDEAAEIEFEAAMAEAEAESAMEAPAEEAADAPSAGAAEERLTADEAAVPVVDLGAFENLESLFDDVTAHWPAALEDGAKADSGTCFAAVRDKELESGVDTGRPFIATVGAEDSLIFDGRFARRTDGGAIIIYAAPPGCDAGTHDLDTPDGS
ncbi:MAG: hypothetical protein F4110_09860 [Acidimicrobiaceae bacterium]|nr:hypothetical protein [Acidimicrobiaceae bacterium]MYA00074.1 hypothetical protein [Acidimicrobiaceae bacterium]MYE76159.1 hypothetical protein [Acidimicrobiaceae bacterium]MYE97986.1 hypothetical protein [Acidimicrobiaceae bacterium]MYH42835.1 hypothetical protein [Acidimicrobiaceae bacterium]